MSNLDTGTPMWQYITKIILTAAVVNRRLAEATTVMERIHRLRFH